MCGGNVNISLDSMVSSGGLFILTYLYGSSSTSSKADASLFLIWSGIFGTEYFELGLPLVALLLDGLLGPAALLELPADGLAVDPVCLLPADADGLPPYGLLVPARLFILDGNLFLFPLILPVLMLKKINLRQKD